MSSRRRRSSSCRTSCEISPTPGSIRGSRCTPSVATAEIASPVVAPVAVRRVSAGLWSDALWRLRHDPTTMVAIAVIIVLAVISVLADVLADNVFHHSFSQQSLLDSYTAPSSDEPYLWLGTDDLGRSQIVRLIYGGRVSLSVGLFGALTSMIIG